MGADRVTSLILGALLMLAGATMGFVAGITQATPQETLEDISKVQTILAALIALLGGGAGLYGVILQLGSGSKYRREDQVMAAQALYALLDEHLTQTFFAIEYQAEHAARTPITSSAAYARALASSNRTMSELAAEAVKRAWSELSKCDSDSRLGLVRMTSVLDKLGKCCSYTAFVCDMLKDYEPAPGETTIPEFVVGQRDLLVATLQSLDLYTDSMRAMRPIVIDRVRLFTSKPNRGESA